MKGWLKATPLKRFGVLSTFALVLYLQWMAIHSHSLTGDGAHHLLAGHQALRYGQNLLNLEHPPLAKLVFSIPTTLQETPLAPPLRVEEALRWVHRVHQEPLLLHRATLSGRYMALGFFVLPLFWACFILGRRHGGRATGILLTLMVGLSFSALPSLTILQTDTAVALAFLLTVLAAERYLEKPTALSAGVLALAASLGLASKFSAVLLAPTVLAVVLLAHRSAEAATWRRRLGHLLLMGALVWAVVDAVYLVANHSYSSTAGRQTITSYCQGEGTVVADERLAAWESRLLTAERFDPYLTQWLTGLLAIRNQNAIGVYASYAFGEVRSSGRWWYFPAVFWVKTPLLILLVALWGLYALFQHKPSLLALPRSSLPLFITVGVYLVVAFTSNYNLGVRHLLPVLPLLYLPVAKFLAQRQRAALLVVAALAVESLVLAPLWMSATNTWWLGAGNPTRFALGTGNLEFRQNFLQLAQAMERKGLEDLKVLYPTLSPEVLEAWVPGAELIQPGDPLDPGWYAVNVTVEQLVPALLKAPPGAVYGGEALRQEAERWQPLWLEVVEGDDHGYVAGTFHLYFLGPRKE